MRPHWSLGILHLKKRRWFSCSSSLFQQKSNVLRRGKEGEIPPSNLSVQVHKKDALLFYLSPKKDRIRFSCKEKYLAEEKEGENGPSHTSVWVCKKGLKLLCFAKGQHWRTVGNVTKKQRKGCTHIFLPTCPCPSVKLGFIFFIGVHRGTCIHVCAPMKSLNTPFTLQLVRGHFGRNMCTFSLFLCDIIVLGSITKAGE